MDRYLQAGSMRVRYQSAGQSGPAVVLVHGLGGFAENWSRNIEPLGKQFRVFAPDLPGFGLSDKPDDSPCTLDFFARFVGHFMDALGLARASLVGSSMGGGISLTFALENPARVEKLVLVGSLGFGRAGSRLLRFLSLPVIGELARPSRFGTQMFLRDCMYDRALVTEELIELGLRGLNAPRGHRSFLRALRSMATFRGIRPQVIAALLGRVGELRVPTLLIWGEHDRVLPVGPMREAADRYRNLSLHVFENCGHLPMYECPEKFNELVAGFIASAPGVAA